MATKRSVVLVVEPDVFLRGELGARLRKLAPDADVLETVGHDEAGRVLDRMRYQGQALAALVTGRRVAPSLAQRVETEHPAAKVIVPADDFTGLEHAFGGEPEIQVVGRRYGERTYAIKDFLYRNRVPFSWHSVESRSGAVVAETLGLTEPVPTTVVLGDGKVLREPSLAELATALGFAERVVARTHDLVVIGGGPAGLAAAVYGACEGLRVAVVDASAPGGQAGSTSRIENYLGFPGGLTGADLAHRALEQARQFGVQWLVGHRVTGLDRRADDIEVRIDDGTSLRGNTVLLATGMQWRRLDCPGADRLAGRGIYYGASLAEAAQTAGEDVHVVGAGNSAGQAALYFADHARSLTLLVRGQSLRESAMSQYLVDRIEEHPRITVRTATSVEEVLGDDRLSGLVLRDARTGTLDRVPAESAYVLIGMEPCTRWLGRSVALDPRGFVLTGESVADAWQLDREPLISETSMPGLFAAGDVCAGTVKRVGAAVGQGAMAMQAIASYLRGRLGRIPAQQRRTPGIRQFDLLDADGNGYVEEQDLAEVARRLVTGFGEPLDSERGRRVIAGYGELWHALVEIADDNGDNRISRDEFAAATAELTSNTPVFRRLAEAVVALCDTDDDGAMNEAEFEKVLATLGVPIEDVGAYYRELDADGSGYLDTSEITVALGQFYGGAELLAAERAAG